MAHAWKLTAERKEKLETAARHVHETAAAYQNAFGVCEQAEAKAEHARMVFVMVCNELLPTMSVELLQKQANRAELFR